MIIEITIGVAALAASSLVTRALWARRAARARATAEAPPAAPIVRGPGLHPGDVVMISGGELALERASELDDGGILRVLETIAAEPRYLVQLDPAGERIVLAKPYLDLPEGRVADVVEIEGRVLTLARRGEATSRPVLPDREGLLAGRVRFTVLADRGGRHLVVLDQEPGTRLALTGDLLDRRLIDVLPGG